MATKLRPSLMDFQRFGWIPDPKAYKEWITRLDNEVIPRAGKLPTLGRAAERDDTQLIHPVQKFKEFIESNPDVYQEFQRMFSKISAPPPPPPNDYLQMLVLWDDICSKPPPFGDLGPPMYMIMARLMNTEGGFSAFTKANLNYHFKEMVKYWQDVLVSPESRSALDPEVDKSWVSAAAIRALLNDFEGASRLDQVFQCNDDEKYHGFTSFEHFFNRKFKDNITQTYRPFTTDGVLAADLENVISSPCEAVFYTRQEDVKLETPLWIKDEEYSLIHLLANDDLAQQFIGGSVYQTFLQPTGYHRWHCPVDGKIVKIIDVPGTYFAQSPEFIGDELYFPAPGETFPEDKPAHPYLRSLAYFSHCAARQLIYIESDNADIGLLCFVAIGMTEISTCEATVRKGQSVKRGDELGMFHFGGSSCALVAGPGVRFTDKYDHAVGEKAKVVPIHAAIGVVVPKAA